jgi:hypothetical protein
LAWRYDCGCLGVEYLETGITLVPRTVRARARGQRIMSVQLKGTEFVGIGLKGVPGVLSDVPISLGFLDFFRRHAVRVP